MLAQLLRRLRRRHGWFYIGRRATRSYLVRCRDHWRSVPSGPRLTSSETLAVLLPLDARHEVFPAEHVDLREPRNASAHFARISGWYPSDRWRTDYDLAPESVFQLSEGIVFGAAGWLGPDTEHVISGWNSYSRT